MEKEDMYIIPHNYTDNGKILGIIEKQSIYAALIFFVPACVFNFKLLSFLSLDLRLFTFILFILPITSIILVGIGGDTFIDFAKYVYNFYKRAGIFFFEK
ncbi:MAG: hypothetical protein QXW71_00050 [Thermoplasmata archaeon]